jgi:hypothetical protein
MSRCGVDHVCGARLHGVAGTTVALAQGCPARTELGGWDFKANTGTDGTRTAQTRSSGQVNGIQDGKTARRSRPSVGAQTAVPVTRWPKRTAWRLGSGVLLTLLLVQACGTNARQYEEASVGLGTALSFTAVNRALTGDCWAQCSHGYACDRKRGLCVRAECVPECPEGEHCVIEVDGRFRCMDAAGVGQIGAGANPTSNAASDAGASSPVDGGVAHSNGSNGSADAASE